VGGGSQTSRKPAGSVDQLKIVTPDGSTLVTNIANADGEACVSVPSNRPHSTKAIRGLQLTSVDFTAAKKSLFVLAVASSPRATCY
jgi:hypothetical protein